MALGLGGFAQADGYLTIGDPAPALSGVTWVKGKLGPTTGKVYVVEFWATWCGPCKAIAPILDELATELDGKLKIAKVNVDDNGDLAAQYGVRAIPTMLLFKGGQLAEQFVGMMDKASLKAKLAGKI